MKKLSEIVNGLTFGNRTEDAREVPKSGNGLFFFLLRNHWLDLIWLNLLFIGCSLAVVTLPAAYSGLVAVCMRWARREPSVPLFATFFREFRSHFFGKLLAFAGTSLVPVSVGAYVYFFTKNGIAFYAVITVGELFTYLIHSYFFAETAVLELPVGKALKNALILVGLAWKTSLRLLLTGGVLVLLCFGFTTYMIPVAVLCVFSLIAATVAAEVNAVIDERLTAVGEKEETAL